MEKKKLKLCPNFSASLPFSLIYVLFAQLPNLSYIFTIHMCVYARTHTHSAPTKSDTKNTSTVTMVGLL